MDLPSLVSDTLHGYLRNADAALPGLIEMLYVVGSVALGAWQPERSDIDTVIVTSRPLNEDDLATLKALHSGFDGVYLDRHTFAQRPIDRRVVPFVVNGEFRVDSPCGELTPVLWLLFARHAIAVRGPHAAEHRITVDPEALRRFNLENLREYWQPLAEQIRREGTGMPQDGPVPGDHVAWMMLGPARLHYTLAYQAIVSKQGAATYLGRGFPQWRVLAERAARWHAGQDETFTLADLRAGAAATDAVIDDAHTRYGGA